jgi:acyl carrier protein
LSVKDKSRGEEMAKMDEGTIFKKVAGILSEALGVAEDEVSLDSHLDKDLGAESIDYLDIIFRIEKEFDFKIPTEIMPEDTKKVDALPGDKNFSELEGKVDMESMMDLATVKAIVDYIGYRLEKGGK